MVAVRALPASQHAATTPSCSVDSIITSILHRSYSSHDLLRQMRSEAANIAIIEHQHPCRNLAAILSLLQYI